MKTIATTALAFALIAGTAGMADAKGNSYDRMKSNEKRFAAARAGKENYRMPGFVERLFGLDRDRQVAKGKKTEGRQ
ncbi:MAG: hypothetical protein AAFR52_12350 [Pseudomonadota bacterium]